MKEIGLGNDKYKIIDIDNDDKEISAVDAVKHVVPFERIKLFFCFYFGILLIIIYYIVLFNNI